MLLLALLLLIFTTNIDAVNVTCGHSNINNQDWGICEFNKTIEYVCLVCPAGRNEMGLIWKDTKDEVLFRGNVRTVKKTASFAINRCNELNYTLSFLPTEVQNGSAFTCFLDGKPLSKFIVNIKDFKNISKVNCRVRYQNDPTALCGTSLNSPACLMCPVLRGDPGLSWKYTNETIFQADVSIGRQVSLLAVNRCGTETYTLSITNLTNEDQGMYSCYLNEKKLAEFFVYNKEFPKIMLTCETGQEMCNLNDLRCETLLKFQCEVTSSRTTYTIVLLVDDVIVQEERYSSAPSSKFVKGGLQYTSNGTERNITCQVREESFTTGSETLHFMPMMEDGMSLDILWEGNIRRSPVTVSKNKTVEFTCVATNVTFPKEVFWEVDNQRLYNEFEVEKMRCGIKIYLSFQPNKEEHNVSCVYRSPVVQEVRRDITLKLTSNTKVGNSSPAFESANLILGILLGVISVFLLYGLFKFRAMFTKKRKGNALYFEMEMGEETAYVRLRTRFSSNGRLERWIGDLTDMTTSRKTCMVNACKENTTVTESNEFKQLAMILKDMRGHVNIVEVIAVEVEKVPNMIYTEFIQGVTLKNHLHHQKHQTSRHTTKRLARFAFEVISGLVHLKSHGLAHPGIRCQKVLLTESLTCKVYDFCTYPVTDDFIGWLLQERKTSIMPWLAKETRLNRTHTFKSDSFSSAVFMWEVFSWDFQLCKDVGGQIHRKGQHLKQFIMSCVNVWTMTDNNNVEPTAPSVSGFVGDWLGTVVAGVAPLTVEPAVPSVSGFVGDWLGTVVAGVAALTVEPRWYTNKHCFGMGSRSTLNEYFCTLISEDKYIIEEFCRKWVEFDMLQ